MPLSAGTRAGPYEILAPLGAGGMGEVYRARDVRLGREVALKVISEGFASDANRLRRFEREARSASSLNVPNIVTIFDIGTADGVTYIAMELVDGKSLRQLIQNGPLPIRTLLAIATQVAEGLARAHEAGIVHRDVKPDNVMVTRDGIAKILDFGLAKRATERGADDQEATATLATEPGSVLGTVRYMSPEQAGGRSVDFRSDQFSFGSVLYEMATGKHAFAGDTKVDTLSAILHQDPEPLARVNPRAPAPLRWIIERCLAKDPGDRYAATADLARDLASVRQHLSEIGAGDVSSIAPSRLRKRRWTSVGAAVLLVVAGLCAGFLAGRRQEPAPLPEFKQLTFRTGQVWSAYFAPNEDTVVYAATWEGHPTELFVQRIGSPESRPLGMPFNLFGISRTSEMAVTVNPRGFEPWVDIGTLARVEMASGAAPREVLEDVEWAGLSPDGKDFAIVREVGGRSTLEYPIGTVLYQATTGFLSHPAVSRDGSRVAFLEHPVRADDAGSVVVVDTGGRSQTLVSGLVTVFGAAWSPRGDEVWYTGSATGSNRSLQAVDLKGRHRPLARVIGSMQLDDVGRTGRVLLTNDQRRQHVVGLGPGAARERDLSWLDYSLGRAISADGSHVLIVEGGEGAGPTYAVFLRGTDGSPAVRLGDGDAQALSPDGRWAAAIVQQDGSTRVAIYPTGPGQARLLPASGLQVARVDFLPDGARILMTAAAPGRAPRLYLQNLEGGPPGPISPEGFGAITGTVSPDGKQVIVRGPDRVPLLFPLSGGEPLPLKSLVAGVSPLGWTADGRHLYVGVPFEKPTTGVTPSGPRQIGILDVETGQVAPWKTIGSPDGANSVHITPDGRSYIYSFVHAQGDLYLVDGLR